VAKGSQAAKRHRQSLKRRTRNYAYRSALRSAIKKARLAVRENANDKDDLVQAACRQLDRMVTKGLIHKNVAARKKSRLLKALHGTSELQISPEPKASAVAEASDEKASEQAAIEAEEEGTENI